MSAQLQMLDLFSELSEETLQVTTRQKPTTKSYVVAFASRARRNKEKVQQTTMFEDAGDATMYMSGVSSIADISGCIKSNANICVNTIDLSDNSTAALIEYLSRDTSGLCFIDSGAFRVVGTSTKKQINFEDVFSFYNKVAFSVRFPERITICAPDIIGNQVESLELQIKYEAKIKYLIEKGVKVIFPLQKGELSLTRIYNKLCERFGRENIIAGLPAAIKAIPRQEFMDFLTIQPPRVHILGANKNKSIVKEAQYKSPNTEFSCDANRLLAYIGQGRPLTELCHDLTDDAVSFFEEIISNDRGEVYIHEVNKWIPIKYEYCLDYSEFDAESATLSLTTGQLQKLCDDLHGYLSELNLTPQKLIHIATNDTVLNFIQKEYSEEFSFLIHDLFWDFYREQLKTKLNKSQASPLARTHAIHVSCENGLFD